MSTCPLAIIPCWVYIISAGLWFCHKPQNTNRLRSSGSKSFSLNNKTKEKKNIMYTSEKTGVLVKLKYLLRSIPSPIVAIFVMATVAMNLLANKSIALPVSWLALDCGIILSWLIFLCMDIITRQFGPKAATMVSVFALVVNLILCGIFFLASIIPGVWGESYVDGMENVINYALDHTFGGTWYVLLGSSIAFLASALVNNFLNWHIGVRLNTRNAARQDRFSTFAIRSWLSTGIGQFVDNLLFALIVSNHFFGWSLMQCFMCAVTGALVELLCEVIFSPIGYRVCIRWKKEKVGEDYIKRFGEKV